MPPLPHGPLTPLGAHAWVVEGSLQRVPIGRKMVIVRGDDGALFVHNAVLVDDATFAAIDALGAVKAIFVPNRYHDMDGGRMRERYPSAKLCGLPATCAALEKKFRAIAPLAPSDVPSAAQILPLPGLKRDESVLELRDDAGVTQVYTDALFNLPKMGGFDAIMQRLTGSAHGFGMTRIGKLALLRDRAAFVRWLRDQAERRDLVRVLLAHGMTVEGDACRAAFTHAAEALS